MIKPILQLLVDTETGNVSVTSANPDSDQPMSAIECFGWLEVAKDAIREQGARAAAAAAAGKLVVPPPGTANQINGIRNRGA